MDGRADRQGVRSGVYRVWPLALERLRATGHGVHSDIMQKCDGVDRMARVTHDCHNSIEKL